MKSGNFIKKSEKLIDFGIIVSDENDVLKCHFAGDKTREPINLDTENTNIKQCFKKEVETNFLKIEDHPKKYRWFLNALGLMSEEEYLEYETPQTES